jgi:hypothetical protein
MTNENTIELVHLAQGAKIDREDRQKVCFVKLYLFEKDFQEPLKNFLIKNKNMGLQIICSKLSGLDVVAPCSLTSKADQSRSDERDLMFSEEMI